MKRFYIVSLAIVFGLVIAICFNLQKAKALELTTVDSSADVGKWSSIKVDGVGRAHISYFDDTNNELRYAYYNGSSWDHIMVDTTGTSGWGTSIDVDSNNYPRIAYYDSSGLDLRYAYCDANCGDATINWTVAIVDDTCNAGSTGPSLAIDDSNNPHIAYYDSTAGNLKYAFHDGLMWTLLTVDNSVDNVGGYPSLDLDSSNKPHVSYADATDGYLEYAYCSGLDCTDAGDWTIETADNNGNQIWRTSMKLDSGNVPHVAYYDNTNKLVRYKNRSGGAWGTRETAGWPKGRYPSLDLDSNNDPFVQYYGNDGFYAYDLLYAYSDGAGSWTTMKVYSGTNAGGYATGSNLDIDSNNVPHISYYDSTNDYLEYAVGTVPTNPTISINGGDAYTNSTSSILTLSASFGTASFTTNQMILSEDQSFSGASWEDYFTSDNFTLSSGEGMKIVFAEYRDALLQESSTATAMITLDQTDPTVAITSPSSTYYGPLTWGQIIGTASDALSGVVSTTVAIQRDSDSKYWDGDSWESASTNLATSGTPTSWTYTISSSNLDDGVEYTIVAIATDNATNTASTNQSFTYDGAAPVTTALPVGGIYTTAQTVVLSAVDSVSGVDATYYTTDGTDPTTGSSTYSIPLEISETTTLKFFSVDNIGNSESINTENYTINIPTPTPDATENYAGGELKIKDIELDKTYHNTKNDTDFYFYRKPTRKFSVRKKLYIKILRKSVYKKAFKRKRAFKTYYKLKLNVGKAKKDTWPNVKKRMKYKVALRYTDAQLAKKQGIKEKNLRLFIKDRKNLWRGPYTVYQNRLTNTLKFKIRNFKHLNELASISSTNRTFSPTFYFRNLKKVRFVIATKKAFRKNYPFNLADQNNYDFE